MSQVTIYLDEDRIARAKTAAAAAQMSLSAWIARLIQERTQAVDANGYPPGFFEHLRANASAWDDFPPLERLRATEVPDLPRESW